MKNADVSYEALVEVIDGLGGRFRTKEVSEDPRVLAAHLGIDGRELNTAVGRVLSSRRGPLGIELVDASQGNARWRRVGSAPA